MGVLLEVRRGGEGLWGYGFSGEELRWSVVVEENGEFEPEGNVLVGGSGSGACSSGLMSRVGGGGEGVPLLVVVVVRSSSSRVLSWRERMLRVMEDSEKGRLAWVEERGWE